MLSLILIIKVVTSLFGNFELSFEETKIMVMQHPFPMAAPTLVGAAVSLVKESSSQKSPTWMSHEISVHACAEIVRHT